MHKTQTFRSKLWTYFIVFAAIILSLLWILQTVFLQQFYNDMMIRNIRSAGDRIAGSSREDDLPDVIDRITIEDSLLVYITDEDGDVIFSSDSFSPYFTQMSRFGMGSGMMGMGRGMGRMMSDRSFDENDGPRMGMYRGLPDDYDQFLTRLSGSGTGSVGYTSGNHYIYGRYITLEDDDDEPAVLYVSGQLDAVGAAASIIRMILLWVTLLSLVIAFVIAWLIARRFSKPVDQLTEQAKMLGGEHYEEHFQKGFCRELDELNDSLSESAAKLSEARNYQKELLANVSHDLRTPLTMIKGYAEMVRDISWEDEEQRNTDTGIIIKEADRLTALVNEILEYSRLQEIDQKQAFSEVDLSALTEEVISRFEPLFAKEGGTIEREIAPGCTVRGNAEMLERAVYNLIDNAIRHSGEDKRITVAVRNGETVELEVRDYGSGIDPAELGHIWEKYYTNRQRGNKGVSGLGLAIVKQIALLHGAEVSAESSPGEGSVFRFSIDKTDFPGLQKKRL